MDPGLRLQVCSNLDCWTLGNIAEEAVAPVIVKLETTGTGTGCRAPLGPPPRGVAVSSDSVTMSWSRLWYTDWVREIVGNVEAVAVSERETTVTRAGCLTPLGPPPRGVAVSRGSVTMLWLDLCRNIGTVPTVAGGGIKLAVDLLAAEELGTANPVPERISSVGLTSRPYVGCESEALTAKVPLGRPNS